MRVATVVGLLGTWLAVGVAARQEARCTLQYGQTSATCELAHFGGFLASPAVILDAIVVADPLHACAPLTMAVPPSTLVLVARGECAFTDKLRHVAAAGSTCMAVMNHNDEVFPMASTEIANQSVLAVVLGRSDSVALRTAMATNAHLPASFRTSTHWLQQCSSRLEALLSTNVPRAAATTFTACARLLDADNSVDSAVHAAFYIDAMTRFASDAHRAWDALQFAAVHSAVAVAAVAPSANHWLVAAEQLQLWGRLDDAAMYYTHALGLDLSPTQHTRAVCGAGLTAFLRAEIVEAKALYDACETVASHAFPTLFAVAVDSFRSLFSKRDVDALLEVLRGQNASLLCRHQVENGRVTLQFASPIVRYYYETCTQMGVFLDELGAFEASLAHFQRGLALCGKASGLHVRLALAIPSVFDSLPAMEAYMKALSTRVDALTNDDLAPDVQSALRPDDAGYLAWTITPPTMLLGYQVRQALWRVLLGHFLQGLPTADVQARIVAMYERLYPAALSSATEVASLHVATKRRVAFVSSWFRSHSVGKLLRGILEHLDRATLEVAVYTSSHFFPISTTDTITAAIMDAVDRFVVLPHDAVEALALLRADAIDVVVFPELGMDAWTSFLAHHRFGRVQCVFWGHPITTGLVDSIDYFLGSDLYWDDDDDEQADAAYYTEQRVRFSSLSTYFYQPEPVALHVTARDHFHLPPSSHVYLCPQTLMKLHPALDVIFRDILTSDPNGLVVLLYSPRQIVWKHRVRDRLAQFAPAVHDRILFLETQPYDKFLSLLATSDVLLDPFPFGGGVTTLDALVVGLPVVTLPAKQTVVTLAAGFCRRLNLSTCIVQDEAAFVATAVALACDKALQASVRQEIRDAHRALYHDKAAVDEWSAFLRTV
ncbi:hypothetical protein SDRG_00446 [Saprolegnia diclina VS20]|uniref:Uncharacterized protein n=1 Tax=Saprolegnia diclina (strain VS20) TaxID=1156394 RepID=T0R708_SAPDV|nr:hypothetical protein SDRG_00446 [Saprolegnia diclina VS20]EQC42721.1 hypothetical protein SDRG_00446 [Saprolegnia diclina VS20]|eukprot:XP_008604144.1 hypothetical protein SDRG_00446 [Saprolegnia diclina VS20]